jgi:protocatechuate 3,4-dioxygenase beta subunit
MKTHERVVLGLACFLLAVAGVDVSLAHGQVVAAAAEPPSAPRPPREFSAKDIAPPTGTGAISGAVVDLDKKPVRRAHVTIEGTGDVRLDRSTITDDQGRFSVTDLPVGRFTVSAEKTGYPRVSYGATRPYRAGAGIFLQAGQKVVDIRLSLASGAGFTGVVYDEHGEPLPGVPVQAWEVRTALSGERTVEFPSAGVETTYTTDEQGRYRIYGLAPGDYVMGTAWFYHGQPFAIRMLTDAELRAAFQSAGQQQSGGDRSAAPDPARYNYSPVFSPGVVDPFAAGVFSLEAGQMRTGVDLRMQFQPMSSVEATITAPDGTEPVTRTTLSHRNIPDALNTMSMMPAASGRYREGSLSPGDWRLSAQVPAEAGKPAMWAIADFTASAGQPITLSLFLQPALVLKGAVRFESALAKPPADLSRLNILLRKVGLSELETATAIDPTGAVSITGVIPGQYSLRATVPAGISGATTWAVKSVVAGGQDVTDRRFEIPSSGLPDLTITFSDVTTELAGAITTATGGPATDYFVIAIPADRAYWLSGSRRIASTRPDGSGRYQFRTLPAGEYRIALTTDLVPEDLRDTAALERLFAQSVAVSMGAGEKKTLDLRTGR